MTKFQRILAFLLSLALITSILPASALAAENVFTIYDGFIEVSVSGKNGGFLINTVQGNLLKKSDDNKDLLYRSGDYDTSFVSFRVGSGADARDYLFGGSYDGASGIEVSQAAEGGEIVAVWSVDGITFKQTISLAEENANEHGMVSIGLTAENNSGQEVPIQARVLLDTCLGDQDYAYYQVYGGSLTNTLQTEQIITDQTSLRSLYAVDDLANSMVGSYLVSEPYKAAIGHWNNLAASLFDFAPDSALNFTNAINHYLTADSACAMYYDLGTVASGGSQSIVSYYGVYSNHTVDLKNSMAVNAVAPLRLELNEDKTAFIRQSAVGLADFEISVSAENFRSSESQDLENVIMAVRSTGRLRSLSDDGEPLTDIDYDTPNPMTIPFAGIAEGQTVNKILYFQAASPVTATYERVTIGMYKDSVTMENLLGEKTVYVLLPGSDGDIPTVSFVSMSPNTIYSSGTRHLYVSVTNETILENALAQGICAFKAYGAASNAVREISSDMITITDGVADIALGDDVELALGSWYLQLEWTDDAVANGIVRSEFQKQTAAVLGFDVSDDPIFKNDCYGVLAAVKYESGSGSAHTYTYRLEHFKDEGAFYAFETDPDHTWKEILLVYRGSFTGDNRYPVKDENGKIVGYRYYTAVSTKTINPNTRESRVDNLITINNCVDFEGGTMSVYYEDYANQSQDRAMESSILCEFDGDLYISDARIPIWVGKAALTKLEQGKDFALVKYDKDGVRKSTTASAITLIWPSVFSYAQTLMGLAFKIAYGQFGVMYNQDGIEIGRTIGFAASMSLSFMTPMKPEDDTAAPDSYFGRMKELWTNWRGASIYQYAYSGDHLNKILTLDMNDDTDAHDNAQKGVKSEIMVPDILFGCGEGFIGLNFTADVTARNMVEYLPKIEGKLSINTINNWYVAAEGNCKFSNSMKMEAKLSFKSYGYVPVLNDLYFYVGGFEPGLNVDGCGVVWITGGGGGFFNLCDTIFCTGSIPPLKLVITASFSLMQILAGTAKLDITFSGLNLTASDLKIANQIKVIKKIQLGLQWLPDVQLNAGIYVSMFEKVIEGQGYMILISRSLTDWFFEAFIRAQLKVPASVPGVGGMTILGADLGINAEKIWGAFEALCVKIGLTYYWGEDHVNFGSAGDKAQPTYPNLLLTGYDGQCSDFPIAYDEENHRTLYAHFGTNFEAPRSAQLLSADDLRLMGDEGAWSDAARTTHKFNLGVYDPSVNASTLVQLNYQAESLEQATALAQSFTVQSKEGAQFPLSFYDGTNVESANANVTWNSETETASFAFTVTDSSQFNKNWFISTGLTPAELILYNVLPMPELSEATVLTDTLTAGGTAELRCAGTLLDELDDVKLYLVSGTDPEEDAGYPLDVGSVALEHDDENDAEFYRVEAAIPADIPAGEYYLRAVYSVDDQLNDMVHSGAAYTVTNPRTPAAVGTPTVKAAGNLRYGVTIPASGDENTTGYLVTVYNEDGTETEINGLNFDKAEAGPTTFEIGGSYESPVRADPSDPDSEILGTELHGLEGGRSYLLEITPYQTFDSDDDGEDDTAVYGESCRTAAIPLPEAIRPTATLRIRGRDLTAVQDLTESTVLPIFTERGLSVNAEFSEAVSGSWILDDSMLWERAEEDDAVVSGAFDSAASAIFELPELPDGDHTLTVAGQAADGDSFSYSYHFTVDSTAPRLLLSSPLNGSPFHADGTVTVAGVTDADATIWISIDNGLETRLSFTRDLNGVFSETVAIPDYNSASSHSIRLWAEDPNGNRTEPREISVSHPGLGDLKDIVIMVDGTVPSSGAIDTTEAAEDRALSVMGVTSSGLTFAMDPDRVHWNSLAAEGGITVDAEGRLSYKAFTKGFVEAMIEMSRGAYRTACLALSTDTPSSMVVVSTTVGGRVTGGGAYDLGATVTLTAFPEDGYLFDHWEITGVEGLETVYDTTLQFSMPGASVTVTAVFVADNLPGDLNGDGVVDALDLVRLKKYLLGEDVVLCTSGDLNADGAINALDLIRLKKYLLDESVELH